MKIAVSGKGGVGKTSITAWLGDYLARRGEKVWMVDADTALSLGQASGLERVQLPEPLTQRASLIEQRIRPAGQGGMYWQFAAAAIFASGFVKSAHRQ